MKIYHVVCVHHQPEIVVNVSGLGLKTKWLILVPTPRYCRGAATERRQGQGRGDSQESFFSEGLEVKWSMFLSMGKMQKLSDSQTVSCKSLVLLSGLR